MVMITSGYRLRAPQSNALRGDVALFMGFAHLFIRSPGPPFSQVYSKPTLDRNRHESYSSYSRLYTHCAVAIVNVWCKQRNSDLAQRSGIYSRDRKFPPSLVSATQHVRRFQCSTSPSIDVREFIFGEVIMNARLNYLAARTLSSILRPAGTPVEPWDQTLNTTSSRASLSTSSSLRS